MRRLLEWGGVAAGIVLVAFGVAAIVLGVNGRSTVRTSPKQEAMRYLAELAWVPQAMVQNPELEWRVVDEATVEVATRVTGSRVPVLLHFDASGDVAAASAEARPRMVGKKAIPTAFRGSYGDYRVVGGVRVPTDAEAG